jgi:nucleotide-binding universal stress UspA family protein
MRRHILIVAADTHIQPELLADAVAEATRRSSDAITVVNVLIPAVLPPTLPASAWPPRLAARLGCLHDAMEPILDSLHPKGRVEIAPCRSVAALLQAVWPVDRLVLVGRAGWSIRRAARGVAPDVIIVPARTTPARREQGPASQPQTIAQRP